MPSIAPIAAPEREQTDESLRAEREKTDRALTLSQEVVKDDAGVVVQAAREHADAVLVAAREKADAKLEDSPEAAIAEERRTEDQILRAERALADAKIERERAEVERLHARHLREEREATDEHLETERERADDVLQYRDDFLGMVCHDLRDLLGGIVMGSTLLSRKASHETEEGRVTLAVTARIERSAARMGRLIGDLVDVASIDAGKLAVAKSRDHASKVIAEAIDGLQAAAAEKGVPLAAECAETGLAAEFDHGRILQVLVNLIANSIKFTPKGGRIDVSCERAGGTLSFCVSDTGEGIPAANLESVFERFSQVGKNDRRGLGLGLYISRCLVEAHGGTIRAESTLGAGTRMIFTLPVGDAA